MKPIKNFGKFLTENTLFEPGTFEVMLKDAVKTKPGDPLYVEKQLAIGTIAHMKRIAKKIGLHVIVINAESIDDNGKSFARFLQDEPIQKTLVIFDDMERASEDTINFIENSISTRKVLGTPISDLYFFAEVHLIDKAVTDYPKEPILAKRNPEESTTKLKPRERDGTAY